MSVIQKCGLLWKQCAAAVIPHCFSYLNIQVQYLPPTQKKDTHTHTHRFMISNGNFTLKITFQIFVLFLGKFNTCTKP
jgi:hypothetical protein